MKLVVSLIISLIIILNCCYDAFAYSIRVGVQTKVREGYVASSADAVILVTPTKKPLFKINKLYKYKVYPSNNNIIIVNNSNEVINTGSNDLLFLPREQNSFVFCKNRWYRGYLRIFSKSNRLNIVNVVDIEDYLKGVVPSEMPSGWRIEALKAQAIAARSYALANINKYMSEGYDLKDTQADQVYKGIVVESPNPSLAVQSTEGQVLVSNNKIVPAYYHSCSGGYTDNEGWSEKIGFVRPVKAHDTSAPNAFWKKIYTKEELNNRLSYHGYDVDKINNLYPQETTDYGRIKQLKIVGNSKTKTISGGQIQSILKLPSNNFSILTTNTSVIISGKGFGHGVGMSQWGAKELAELGYNVYEILAYYYKNVEIRLLNKNS